MFSYLEPIRNGIIKLSMIRKVLRDKYGEFVVGQMLTSADEVIWDNYNADGPGEQGAVREHIRMIRDAYGCIVPETFLKVDWGMDFSSWLGPFNGRKDFMFVGAEPHISKNYQLVYDFGVRQNEFGSDVNANALFYAMGRKDIWYYLVKNFVTNPEDDTAIVDFLTNVYITDLCHIVPKGCGQVNQIETKLNIKAKEWRELRTRIAMRFLPEEIEAVNPRFIVLHGLASRSFVAKNLPVSWAKPIPIDDYSNRHVYHGMLNERKVIAIPHLKGQILNELWRSKNERRRNSIRSIIQDLVQN